MPARVVVVGAGISGVACARVLTAAGHAVRVLDRGRRIGGRMAARTLDTPVGRHVTDTGASYFTVSDDDFRAVVEDWLSRGLARPWTDRFAVHDGRELVSDGGSAGPLRYAGSRGLRALVEELATELDVTAAQEVGSVVPTVGGVLVDTARCDVAVLAMPDAQAARLLPAEVIAELRGGEPWPWSPVLSVLTVWRERWWPAVDGVFVNGSATLSWLADDGRRRGDGAPVLVAHTTGDLARRWLDEPDAAVPAVLAEVGRVLADDPERVPDPEAVFVHRWRLAQPERRRPAPDYALVESAACTVALCGDAWGERPRVEGAWLSGARLGHELAARLG